MEGFFSKQETQSVTRPDGKTYSCFSCGLYKSGCSTPKMKPSGQFKKEILNVFDYPTPKGDVKGTIFSGRELGFVKDAFAHFDIDLEKDCLNTSVLRCTPYDEKGEVMLDKDKKIAHHISSCHVLLMKLIQQYKPKLILLHGQLAVRSIIGNIYKGDLNTIEQWRGFVIPDQTLKCYIAPLYSVSYVLSKDLPHLYLLYAQDLERALNARKNAFPIQKPPVIKTITKLDVLRDIKFGTIAFDYETTGLKPQAKGHRIVCCSVATSPDEVYVFMMPKIEDNQEPFIDLLRNKAVKKMAHNMKFEESWSFNILGTRVQNWYWDSMLRAHILDNREGITGLKFQAYVNFGVEDYSSEISPYLQVEDANSKNTIDELLKKPGGKEKLLKYCALDSIYEYRLALLQQEKFNNILPF